MFSPLLISLGLVSLRVPHLRSRLCCAFFLFFVAENFPPFARHALIPTVGLAGFLLRPRDLWGFPLVALLSDSFDSRVRKGFFLVYLLCDVKCRKKGFQGLRVAAFVCFCDKKKVQLFHMFEFRHISRNVFLWFNTLLHFCFFRLLIFA